jgi:hypothetical protein
VRRAGKLVDDVVQVARPSAAHAHFSNRTCTSLEPWHEEVGSQQQSSTNHAQVERWHQV